MTPQDILLFTKARAKQWIYIAPIAGVILTDDTKHEFRINNINLISAKKLLKNKRKYGLVKAFTNPSTKKIYDEFFQISDTYAITWHSGEVENAQIFCRKMVRKELAILAISQLGYGRRRLGPYPTLHGEGHIKMVREFLFDTKGDGIKFSGQVTGNMQGLALHGNWLNFQKENFFIKLLKILRGEIKTSKKWQENIERACILIGQGLGTNDVPQSFLWNMIALESLFKENNEKFSTEFPKIAEAFLGWLGFWKDDKYESRIKELYQKRCDFVHEGKREHITIEDLLFTDNLVYNLLNNVVQHIELFSNKQAILNFSKKVEAEHILGIKSKIRPKTLTFMPKNYYKQDLQEL